MYKKYAGQLSTQCQSFIKKSKQYNVCDSYLVLLYLKNSSEKVELYLSFTKCPVTFTALNSIDKLYSLSPPPLRADLSFIRHTFKYLNSNDSAKQEPLLFILQIDMVSANYKEMFLSPHTENPNLHTSELLASTCN